MKAQDNIDFSRIEWDKIKRKEADFFYNEAIAYLDLIHKNIEGITNKAIGMLSFSMPILTALAGFFVFQWGSLSAPLLAALISSMFMLFAALFLLLLILVPKGINSAQGEPKAYLSGNYHLSNMGCILKGNIQTVHQYIIEDRALLNWHGKLLRYAIVLLATFPVFAIIVWTVASSCVKPCL
jgi:hypothetical protein